MQTLTQAISSDAPGGPVYRRILGLDFFCGSAEDVIARMQSGGLLVVPSAPALRNLETDMGYRDALLAADLVIPDSAYMVLLWRLFEWVHIRRLSGLEYMDALLQRPEMQVSGRAFWVMASESSAKRNLEWLAAQGIVVPEECVYVAPEYKVRDCEEVADPILLARLATLRPQHVIVTIGGGTQERLGHYLKRWLPYLPAIHCTGAAIAFLSGDQVRIPVWADRMQLGWLVRTLSDPRRFVPRYAGAFMLWRLMFRYRSEMPPLCQPGKTREQF